MSEGSDERRAAARADVASLLAEAGAAPAGLASADDQLLAEVALAVKRKGLETPAVLWLESLRPLSFLGAQAMHFLTPFVQAFMPADRFRRLASVLEERANLERLVRLVEVAANSAAAAKDRGGGA